MTLVNLSVEIAASVDELFSNHKDVLIFDDINTKNFIINTLCKCIEDNYGCIAPIPMIDWKIAAMKAACTYVVQSFIDVFLEKKDINDTYIGAVLTGIKKSHDSESLTTQSEIEAFLNGVMELRLSIIFNQLLCIFVADSLGDHYIVDGAAKLSDISHWMNVKTAYVQFPQKIFSIQSELQNYTKFVSNYKGNTDAEKKYLKERIDNYEKRARLLFTRIENGKDLLLFCNEQNKFVKKYIDILGSEIDAALGKESSEKSSRNDSQSGKLAQLPTSRGEREQRFAKIQRAVKTAIDNSSGIKWVAPQP